MQTFVLHPPMPPHNGTTMPEINSAQHHRHELGDDARWTRGSSLPPRNQLKRNKDPRAVVDVTMTPTVSSLRLRCEQATRNHTPCISCGLLSGL